MVDTQNDQSLYTGHFVQYLAAAFLSVFFLLVGYFNWQSLQQDFNYQLNIRADELKAAASTSFDSLQQQMLALASLIVLDDELHTDIQKAYNVWQQEGEGRGGEVTQQLRQQLLYKLEPSWHQLQDSLGIRQMHLHFADQQQRNISFLRIHAPEHYGDDLTGIRPLIDQVHVTGQTASGFEIGRYASGIRGAIPLLMQPQQSAVLELGTNFETQLQRLDEQFSSGFAILLEREQVRQSLTDERYRQEVYHIDGCDYFLEASSREEVSQILLGLSACKKQLLNSGSWQKLKLDNQHYLIIHTIYEHPLSEQHNAHALIWQDITPLQQSLQQSQWQLAQGTLLIWVLVQLALVIILQLASHSLRQRLIQTRNQLANSNNRMMAVIEHFHAAVLLESEDRKVLQVNQRYCHEFAPQQQPEKLSGKTSQLLLQQTSQYFVEQSDFVRRAEQLLEKRSPLLNEELNLKDGRTLERDYVAIEHNGQFLGHLWVYRDVTLHKQQQEALSHLARTDSLTELPNRRYFMERLNEELHRCRRHNEAAALIMFDIDHFKLVNDTWGHAVGDEVLQEIAQRTRSCLRITDLAGRLGGEEFSVLLPGTDEQGGVVFAERLRRSIADTSFATAAGSLNITISLGISRLTTNDHIPDEPLLRADQALYRAKDAGRNRAEVAGDDCQ